MNKKYNSPNRTTINENLSKVDTANVFLTISFPNNKLVKELINKGYIEIEPSQFVKFYRFEKDIGSFLPSTLRVYFKFYVGIYFEEEDINEEFPTLEIRDYTLSFVEEFKKPINFEYQKEVFEDLEKEAEYFKGFYKGSVEEA